ncbi:MAG: Nickel transporter UreH [Myxococcaceae bacterium]|nr:Nickel transporter UreH [Myxococcaceae bacterium]
MLAPLIAATLGVLLGIRHACEPDHLAAVSTLAAEERSVKGGLFLGALWGVGHSLALLLVGGSLAVIETQMPPRVADALELGVGLMVIGLGLRAIVRAVREGRTGRVQSHRHGEVQHAHPAEAQHVHVSRWTLATRPLLVGIVHGLAGSGALTALVLAELPSVGARLTYIALFGAGSVVGMGLLSGLCGVPLARLQRAPRLMAACLLGVGVFSVSAGSWWGFSAAERLFG